MPKKDDYNKSIFVNCPFDQEYKPLFNVMIFAIHACGFKAKCALEDDDCIPARMDIIKKIINECRYGIHDLSRVQLDSRNKLPRFNMPLELGIFVGAKYYGDRRQKQKAGLILDAKKYRYQKYISDISGQDIKYHGNKVNVMFTIIADWLYSVSKQDTIPSGGVINKSYKKFIVTLPKLCEILNLNVKKLSYSRYITFIEAWLANNPVEYKGKRYSHFISGK